MTEAELQAAIMRDLGARQDLRLWRANAGAARDRAGRLVRFGLPGQADLSGILVGGRRLEIEVKSASGRQSREQKRFGAMISLFGGLYIVARSVESAIAAIDAALAE